MNSFSNLTDVEMMEVINAFTHMNETQKNIFNNVLLNSTQSKGKKPTVKSTKVESVKNTCKDTCEDNESLLSKCYNKFGQSFRDSLYKMSCHDIMAVHQYKAIRTYVGHTYHIKRGELVGTYGSIQEASKKSNVGIDTIQKSLYGIYKTSRSNTEKGVYYVWEFILKPVTHNRGIIVQFEHDGTPVQWFKDSYEACRITGYDQPTMSKLIQGKLNPIGKLKECKYMWKTVRQLIDGETCETHTEEITSTENDTCKPHTEKTKWKVEVMENKKYMVWSVFENIDDICKEFDIDKKYISISKFHPTLTNTSCGYDIRITPISHLETESQIRVKPKKQPRKYSKFSRVDQYTSDGKFVKSWNTISEVKRECGYDPSSISKCISGKYRTVGGYMWKGVL